MGVTVQSSDLHGYAQKTPETVSRTYQITTKHSMSHWCVLQNLLLLTSSAENSPELVQTFHLRHLQISQVCPVPSRIAELTFSNHSAERFIYSPMFSGYDLLKANILLTNGPSTLLKTVQQKICKLIL